LKLNNVVGAEVDQAESAVEQAGRAARGAAFKAFSAQVVANEAARRARPASDTTQVPFDQISSYGSDAFDPSSATQMGALTGSQASLDTIAPVRRAGSTFLLGGFPTHWKGPPGGWSSTNVPPELMSQAALEKMPLQWLIDNVGRIPNSSLPEGSTVRR